MSASRLISFFSTFTRLPVYVEDVVGQMIDMGVQDEIILVPMDVSPNVLLGMLVRYRETQPPYCESRNVALVFYNINVGLDEQRLICCKELMHLFDARDVLTSNAEDLFTLVEGVIDVSSIVPGDPKNTQAIFDHIAYSQALAVLFPHEIRDDIIAAHESGRTSVGEIARELDIPAMHIPMLLSKSWDAMRAFLMKL